MADNVPITAGAGTSIAADDISSVFYQRVKLSLGADGVAVDAVAGAGAVSTGVQRVTLASNDPAVVAIGAVGVLPATLGAKVAAGSVSVVLSTENLALIQLLADAVVTAGAIKAGRALLVDASGAAIDLGPSVVSLVTLSGVNNTGISGGPVGSGGLNSTNPIKAAAVYTAAGLTPTNGNLYDLQMGPAGGLRSEGTFAQGATAAGDLQRIGGTYFSSAISALTDGKGSSFLLTDRGSLRVMPVGFSLGTMGDNLGGNDFNYGQDNAVGQASLPQKFVLYAHDGSSNLRSKMLGGAKNTTGQSTVLSVDQALLSVNDATGLVIDNSASASDLTLVTATASQTTRGHSLELIPTADVTVTVKNGVGGSTLRKLPLKAGVRYSLEFRGRPHFVTSTNTALVLSFSAAVQVDGYIEFNKTA